MGCLRRKSLLSFHRIQRKHKVPPCLTLITYLLFLNILQAWKNWREGEALNLVDSTLKAGSTNEIMRCIHIGLLCVQENVADRPTMSSVVRMLNSYSFTLPIPLQPAFFMHSNIESDTSAQWEYDPKRTDFDRSKGSLV